MPNRMRYFRHQKTSRRGAIAALVAVLLPVLVLLSAFAVNVSYMQMVRQQLRVACDASAKAALVNYGATQQQSSAIGMAQTVAASNAVAGSPITVSASNLVFGNASKGNGGVYAFQAGVTPMNSVQLTGTVSAPLFMSTFLPTSSFRPTQVSIATRISHDICLVLDRSASMAFDLSVNEFTYPADVGAGRNPLQCYFLAPSATASRWASLTQAVNTFIGVLQARNLDVHLSLVTYSETFNFGTFSASEASLDVTLTSNFNSTLTAMNGYGANPLLGDTNISAGLALAQGELTGPRADDRRSYDHPAHRRRGNDRQYEYSADHAFLPAKQQHHHARHHLQCRGRDHDGAVGHGGGSREWKRDVLLRPDFGPVADGVPNDRRQPAGRARELIRTSGTSSDGTKYMTNRRQPTHIPRGTAAVEFALCASVLFAFVCGTIEVSRMLQVQHTVREAALEGARAGAALDAQPNDPVNQATTITQALGVVNPTITVTPNPITYTSPTITVTVSADPAQNCWLLWYFRGSNPIIGSITMDREVMSISVP